MCELFVEADSYIETVVAVGESKEEHFLMGRSSILLICVRACVRCCVYVYIEWSILRRR